MRRTGNNVKEFFLSLPYPNSCVTSKHLFHVSPFMKWNADDEETFFWHFLYLFVVAARQSTARHDWKQLSSRPINRPVCDQTRTAINVRFTILNVAPVVPACPAAKTYQIQNEKWTTNRKCHPIEMEWVNATTSAIIIISPEHQDLYYYNITIDSVVFGLFVRILPEHHNDQRRSRNQHKKQNFFSSISADRISRANL